MLARLSRLFPAALIICTVVITLPVNASHDPAAVRRNAAEPRLVVGIVDVDRPVGEVFGIIRDIDGWDELFGDLRTVEVKRRTASGATVELDSRMMGHASTVEVRIDAQRRFIRFDGAEHGIRYWLKVRADPSVSHPGGTRVTTMLFADTEGLVGWFIPEHAVRALQLDFAASYLADLAAAGQG